MRKNKLAEAEEFNSGTSFNVPQRSLIDWKIFGRRCDENFGTSLLNSFDPFQDRIVGLKGNWDRWKHVKMLNGSFPIDSLKGKIETNPCESIA